MSKKRIIRFLSLYLLLLLCVHSTSFFIKETAAKFDGVAIFYSSNPEEMNLRLKQAIVLNKDELFYFTLGGARPYKNYYGSSENSKYLKSNGIKDNHIKIDLTSYDTRGNLIALNTLNSERKKVALVTDNYHLARIAVLNKFNPLPFETLNSPSEMPSDLRWRFKRLNYELIAWGFMVLPTNLQEFLLLTFR